MNVSDPQTLQLMLTGALFLIGAGGVHLWRKGDDKTDAMRKELIDGSVGCAAAGWSVCAGIGINLAAGDIVAAIAEFKLGIAIALDPVKRLAHTGEMTMANINSLLKDPRFGPQIRKAVKDQNILIASADSTTSSPV